MQTRPLSELKNWEKNPRNINTNAFARLKKQLRMGQHSTLLTMPDGTVLGGNMRLRGMQELNKEFPQMFEEVKCIEIDFKEDGPEGLIAVVDGEEIRDQFYKTKEDGMMAYSLSHNDEAGYYDKDLMANIMPTVNIDTDMFAVNFEPLTSLTETLQSVMGGDNIQEDEPPEVSTQVSTLGEVYSLGRHRLMCGDATNSQHVETLVDMKEADMVFTDPPYNVDYEGKTKEALKIKGDKMDNDSFYKFLYDSFVQMFNSTKDGGSFYICHADTERINFTKAFIDAGGYLSSIIIWAKNNATFGRQDYFWKHEPILYGWSAKGTHDWYGNNEETTLWNIDRPSASKDHPTMKPLALVARAVKNSSRENDIVLDLFGGSGSTLIACEQINRTCFMMELDPKYCDVIRKRYAKFIGKEDSWESETPAVVLRENGGTQMNEEETSGNVESVE